MKSNLNICFIGGDKRQKYAAEELARSTKVNAVGKCFCGASGVSCFESPEKAIIGCRAIVLPMPAARSEDVMDFDTIARSAKGAGALIVGGMLSEYMKDEMNSLGVKYVDYGDDEAFTIKNAYITAEGALFTAMQELDKDIKHTCFAVLGYGRIGSALADILAANKGKVTVYARRSESLALANEKGLIARTLSPGDKLEYDVIFNTVPSRIITNEQIFGLDARSILIELASAPGGFDFEIAEQSGIRAIKASGLPGKYAPVTAGAAVAEAVLRIFEGEALL